MTQVVPAPPDSPPDSESTAALSGSKTEGKPGQKIDFKKKLRLLIPLGLLLVAAGFGLRYWLTRPDDEVIQLSGRIESYQSDLGAKVGGQVESVAVREGDLVTAGQVVAQLDDKELLAQLEAAKATVSAAQQKITQAELQIDVVASQVRED